MVLGETGKSDVGKKRLHPGYRPAPLKMVVIRGARNYPSYNFFLRSRLQICPTKSGHHWNTERPQAQMGTVHRGSEETGNYHTYVRRDKDVGQEIE